MDQEKLAPTRFKREYKAAHKYRCTSCGKRIISPPIFVLLEVAYHSFKHWLGDQSVFFEILVDHGRVESLRQMRIQRMVDAYNETYHFDKTAEVAFKDNDGTGE